MSTFVALLCLVLAQGDTPPPDPGDPPSSGGLLSPLIMFGAVFVLMWLFVLRPQKQREQEEKSMLDRLKKNDKVVTKGGLFGVVMNVKDDEVVLRIDETQNVKVRFQRSAIAAILGEDDKAKAEEKKA